MILFTFLSKNLFLKFIQETDLIHLQDTWITKIMHATDILSF
jgi:hypothetical protein